MQRFWVFLSLGLLSGGAALTLHDVHRRVRELESKPRVDPAQVKDLRGSLLEIEGRVAKALDAIGELRRDGQRTHAMQERLSGLEGELRKAAADLGEQECRLTEWEEAQRETPRRIESIFSTRVGEVRQDLDEQCRQLSALAEKALGLAQSTQSEISSVEQGLTRDEDRMWRELVAPVVQLSGEDTVGSGVLLASEPIAGSQDWRTYLVTAWHVVRDIEKDPEHSGTPVPVTIYGPDHEIRSETASVLRFDVGLDTALLVLDSTRKVEWGARIASRERLSGARIFDQVYAVGCPLGNDPIPTFGEIADTDHVVDGARYWMISAPTYIGNSGGGIFDARTHELMGIFSKIYTHGTLRPTVVPHMGLVTSIETMYGWLEEAHYAGLVHPPATTAQALPAAAQK